MILTSLSKGLSSGDACFCMLLMCLAIEFPTTACRHPQSSREDALRREFHQATGHIVLPPGTIELRSPLEFERGAHDIDLRGDPAGSILKLTEGFKGRAAIIGTDVANISIQGLEIMGNRGLVISNLYLPRSDQSFVDYYSGNGIVFVNSRSIRLSHIAVTNVISFSILISHSRGVAIESVSIQDSGTLNLAGHSNTTGGILLEQGTSGFTVKYCRIKNVRGNGIWTHSTSRAPRNSDGTIAANEVWGTPRDAIQVGHATRISVAGNRGGAIGFPPEEADLPGGATPVALDSAGDVSATTYAGNHFRDVNGQCIDLDGFHDGRVIDNSCVNWKSSGEYPLSHEGIVFGNSNPDMSPQGVLVARNLIQGFGYGGVYLIGQRHDVSGNWFIGINRNHCTGDMRIPRCGYAPDEPGMLRSGIYLASHAARPTRTSKNKLRDNYIGGFGMDRWCISAGPGVSVSEDDISNNKCVAAF